MNGRNRMFFDSGDSINWFCNILPTIMHRKPADPEYDIQTAIFEKKGGSDDENTFVRFLIFNTKFMVLREIISNFVSFPKVK